MDPVITPAAAFSNVYALNVRLPSTARDPVMVAFEAEIPVVAVIVPAISEFPARSIFSVTSTEADTTDAETIPVVVISPNPETIDPPDKAPTEVTCVFELHQD